MVRVTMSHSSRPVPYGASPHPSSASGPVASNNETGEGPKSGSCGSKGPCHCGCKKSGSGLPDFANMTSEERLQYHLKRIALILGDKIG